MTGRNYAKSLNPHKALIWRIVHRPNDDILILVSSLPRLRELALPFVFTDSHAYCQRTEFYTDLDDLNKIDWPILQRRDFRRDLDDPRKLERYQAEALVHRLCPTAALLGVICHSAAVESELKALLEQYLITLPVYVRPEWYFP